MSSDYLPFCTAVSSSPKLELQIHDEAVSLLEKEDHCFQKILVFSIIEAAEQVQVQVQEEQKQNEVNHQRGIYISKKGICLKEIDNNTSAFSCILRGVSLTKEPFWGTLLIILSSHLFFASHGGISSSSSFNTLNFLRDYVQIQVLENNTSNEEEEEEGKEEKEKENTICLKHLTPKFTWAAIDLKTKEIGTTDSPSVYFERKLATPPSISSSSAAAAVDMAAQMMLHGLFDKRDCIMIKSSGFKIPSHSTVPMAYTSSKITSHAIENAQLKPLFGRFVCGALLVRLVQSFASHLSHNHTSKMSLQRLVRNVYVNFWQDLLHQAYSTYRASMHARLSTYEKVEMNAEYLIDLIERKMHQKKKLAVVNNGQGAWSTFDEFGNLKRQQPLSDSNDRTGSGKSYAASSPSSGGNLEPGLLNFIKARAGRAMSSLTPQNCSNTLASLPLNPEKQVVLEPLDKEKEEKENVDEILEKCQKKLRKFYPIPFAYKDIEAKSMPVDLKDFNKCHAIALAEAKSIVFLFLKLKIPKDERFLDNQNDKIQALVMTTGIDFQVGKKNLMKKIKTKQKEFEIANAAASASFCSDVLKYLHCMILKKIADEMATAKLRRINSVKTASCRRSSCSSLNGAIETNSRGPRGFTTRTASLSKLPLELLAYKSNVEAMISQYNFIAKGPFAKKILASFLQTPVRLHAMSLVSKECNQFQEQIDLQKSHMNQYQNQLILKQDALKQYSTEKDALLQEEHNQIHQVEQNHLKQAETFHSAIRNANEMIQKALYDQQILYQNTIHATTKTIRTIDQVSVKHRPFMGYLEKYEAGFFKKNWRQMFFVLDGPMLKCFKTKSDYEERGPTCEPSICLTGFSIIASKTDDAKIKILPPEAGQYQKILRFRAPASVGRKAWMRKFYEATQMTK